MKCNNCNHEVEKTTTIYRNGGKIEFCKYCSGGIELADNKEYLKTSGIAGCSIAHLKDIKSRRTDWKTGEIYRERKKTFFIGK